MTRPIFPLLWACAALFHIAALPPATWTGTKLVVGVAAVVTLWAPEALLILALAQLADWVHEMPTPSNHWMMTAAVNATIVVACASSRSTLYATIAPRFAPYARWCVIVLYAFAVFHKLNWDFVDPAHSCGGFFVAAQTGFVSATSAWAGIVVTLGAEAAILCCLLWRRTRAWGILVGAVFHTVVALNPLSGFYNFSAMLLALFALFVPDEDWRHAVAAIGRRRRALLAGAAVCAIAYATAPGAAVTWAAYAVVVTAMGVVAYLQRRQVVSLWAPWSVTATIPLLLVLNGAAPYLGLKTEVAFSMYSNLRTEDGVTNHMLVPANIQWFSYQRDVTVLPDGTAVPSFEISRNTTAPAGTTDWLLRKVLAFRVFDQGLQRCRH